MINFCSKVDEHSLKLALKVRRIRVFGHEKSLKSRDFRFQEGRENPDC